MIMIRSPEMSFRGIALARRWKTALWTELSMFEGHKHEDKRGIGAKGTGFHVFLLRLHHSRQTHPIAAISLGMR
ncbi:MAG: hypothetical protein J2P53_12375, partial [Bradyrhizobiaceae bacterium]|nr:hypothetical protein [Bradyrhizobiaceae bacterium]